MPTSSCSCGTSILSASSSRCARVSRCCAASGSRSTPSRRRSTTPSRRRIRSKSLRGVLDELERRLPGSGHVARALSGVPRPVRDSEGPAVGGVRRRDRGLPRAHARAHRLAGRRKLHARVRHEQELERLQLVSGQLPQPDPDQHGSADLHRPRDRSRVSRRLSRPSRLQRVARAAPRSRPRLAGVLGVSAVLAAVVDRRGDGQLRHRGRVSRRRAGARSSATCCFRPRASMHAKSSSSTRSWRSSRSSRTPATRLRAVTSTGAIDAAAAQRWLETYTLSSPERAAQRVRFFDQYRAYVINYNLGKDLVAAFVERRAGTDPERRWQEFARLISSPRLPSGLAQ